MKEQHFIYFVQFGLDGPIKIGITTDVRKRLAALQNHAVETLYLRAVMLGTQRDEKALHAKLTQHRLRGEWFQPVPEILDLMAQVDSPDLHGVKLVKQSKIGARLSSDEAYRVWSDPSLTVADALEQMLGWNYKQAYYEFGARPGQPALSTEEAKRRGALGGAVTRARSVTGRWRAPEMADALAVQASIWRDPKHGRDRNRERLHPELRALSDVTLWRLFRET